MANTPGSIPTEFRPSKDDNWLGSNDTSLRDALKAVVSRNGFALNHIDLSTANTTIDIRYNDYFIDSSGGAIALTLPAANSWGAGKSGTFRFSHKTGASNTTVTLTAGDTLAFTGGTSITIRSGDIWEFRSDGISSWAAGCAVPGANLSSPPPIGNVAPNTGAFTTLTATTSITGGSGSFTTLSASSTVSGTGFSNYLASPPAIGSVAAAAGTFTTLTSNSLSTAATTISGLLTLTGGQIKFPATQIASSDANTLDDYVEANWTPSYVFATIGNLSNVYTTQVGRLTKIGRLVVASFDIAVTPTFTTASGALQIAGLPYSSASVGTRVYGGTLNGYQNITKANYTSFVAQMVDNSAVITIGASGSGQPFDDVLATNVTSGSAARLRGFVLFSVV